MSVCESQIEHSAFCPGEWVWSNDFNELVRINEIKELWGYTTCNVWVPSKTSNLNVVATSLTKKIDLGFYTKERLLFTAAVAKVVNAIAQDVLLAPLEGGLIPLPHQLAVLEKVISGNNVRYLLADEVGLGKTIEAGLIMRELKLRGLVQRVLVIAPKGLTSQWAQEMKNHFNENFRLITSFEFPVMASIFEDANLWNHFDQVICSLDSVKPISSRRGWSQDDVDNYNMQRFEGLINAGWDLVIIDEAHRLGGSSATVSRHLLGKKLSEATPYLLLLSATPHQGKSDAFQRLLSLIDKQEFPPNAPINHAKVKPYVIRTEKRKAVDAKGKPLFKERTTKLVPVTWEPRHKEQEELYNNVTEYVRNGYNQAVEEKKNYLGFLMVLMQRLVSSSTRAIRHALENRLRVLDGENSIQPDQFGSWEEMDSQEQLDTILSTKLEEVRNERETVQSLLNLAIRCEALHPDARAEALLECIHTQQIEENDVNLKFLVFTEFVSTQEMLKEFLEQRGFSCVTLNGSMNLEERIHAQEIFAREARILISTDAGGEGLNLQFCHIVINYDLPWNPMKVEQRIGRVDRIGQDYPVKAFNFIFENTVEYRVQEVLQEKLSIILSEFGVDKTSDVLDTADKALDFEKVYINSLLKPEILEYNISEFTNVLREEFQSYQYGNKLLPDIGEIPSELAEQLSSHPLPYWLETMTLNFIKMNGGKIEKTLNGYNLTLPDGTVMENITFKKTDADKQGLHHLTVENGFIRSIFSFQKQWSKGQPIPKVSILSLSQKITGYFSLWKISIKNNDRRSIQVFPLFVTSDGKTLKTTAHHIWEILLDNNARTDFIQNRGFSTDQNLYGFIFENAKEVGKEHFIELKQKYTEYLEKEKEKWSYSFRVRREAINRIGLTNVREKRRKELDNEEAKWQSAFQQKEFIFPELEPLLMVQVEA
jgi:SNF2 family DNA or RNA helicase